MKRVMLAVFSAVMVLFLASMVNADTTITVETYPNHIVSIEVVDTTMYMNSMTSSIGNSSSSGIYSATYAGNKDFYINMFVSSGEDFVVPSITFGPYPSGENLKFSLKKLKQEQIIEEPECIENWTCGDWTECSEEGEQARTCTDANNCDTAESKPAESQECEPPKSALTGFVVDLKDRTLELNEKINWMYVLYFVLGIILVGGIVMFIVKKGRSVKKILVFKRGDEGRSDAPNLGALDIKRIEQAEKKIEEAKGEIEEVQKEIKNLKISTDEELEEAELNFEEAKRKLEEIRNRGKQ